MTQRKKTSDAKTQRYLLPLMIGIALKTKIFCVDVVGERFSSSSWRGVGIPNPGRLSTGSPYGRVWVDLVHEDLVGITKIMKTKSGET